MNGHSSQSRFLQEQKTMKPMKLNKMTALEKGMIRLSQIMGLKKDTLTPN